ncbi:MAG TPA: ATP-binding protein, partial [Propionibacteriaceae bacterium]|nr:ATP-binding protein [Propionibacteriaceae bacterium]
GELNDKQDEYLRDILSSGKHLFALLNEILDLSKVEAGRMELEISTVSVPAAIEYAISMVRERAARHRITINSAVAETIDQIESDELRLRQVLVNLLSNAVKFTPDGGRVDVMADPVGNELVITVRDNGPGIAREDWEPIFESFQQGRRGAPSEEGTGLGLTLCRKIMTLLGGRIWLESEVGVGSAFHVAMPFERTMAEASAGTGEQVDGRRSVVIIDDDRASQELLTAYLVGTGVQVVRARDGIDGLEEIRRRQPAAVVLDILLPGMDGWTVLDELRSDVTTRDVPVIIVSILDEKSRGLARGAASYLTKPVSRDDLIEALRNVKVLNS